MFAFLDFQRLPNGIPLEYKLAVPQAHPGSSGEKRPFCDILSQLKPILMHSSALEPPCDARSYELEQKILAVRRPSKQPLE